MTRRLLATISALALAAVLPFANANAQDTPPDDQGSVGIRLAEAPEALRDDPRARLYIIDHLHQGDTITRRVEVSSTLTTGADLTMYVGAASVDDGRFAFGSKEDENDLTDWSSIDPTTVHLEPGGTAQAAVTIAIPDDAVDGERYGVIWAELPSSGGQASVVNRVGVRIYLSVGEGDEPRTDFTIDTLTAAREADGTPVVATRVTNTGERALDLSGTLRLENGPGSLTAGPFNVEVGTTLGTGESAPAIVHLDPSLPNGPWDATVTIVGNRLEKTATATITFPDEPGESGEPVEASDVEKQRKVLLPIALLLLLLVLAALLLFLYRRRKAKRDEAEAEAGARV